MPTQKNNNLLIWLGIFSLAIIFFGIWQIRYTIYKPFEGQTSKAAPTNDDIVSQLQKTDSDHDSLTDIEEMRLGTSPFLPDSDNDGFTDSEETKAGSSPLDPKSTPLSKNTSSTENILQREVVGILSSASSTFDLEDTPSPAQIRDFLIKNGMDKETVNQILDKDLLELYNETKKQTGVSWETLNSAQNSSATSTNPDLQNMGGWTMQELRQYLVSQGIDQTTLDKIDDQTLLQMFNEVKGSSGQ
jgi:hypothetical protein